MAFGFGRSPLPPKPAPKPPPPPTFCIYHPKRRASSMVFRSGTWVRICHECGVAVRQKKLYIENAEGDYRGEVPEVT